MRGICRDLLPYPCMLIGLDLTRGPGAHPVEVVGPGEGVMSQPTGPDRAQSRVCLELVGTGPQNRMYSERKGVKEATGPGVSSQARPITPSNFTLGGLH